MDEIKIIFDNFDKAMGVHEKVFTKLRETGYITFRELGDILHPNGGWCHAEYLYFGKNPNIYGWDNLQNLNVEEDEEPNNWVINFPQPINLEKEID